MQHNNSVRQHFPICIPAPLCTHPADSGFLCGSRDYLYSHCSPHCPQRLMLLRQTAAFSVLSNKEKGTAMAVVPLKQWGQLCGHTREYITKNPKDREKNGPCSNSNLGSVFHQDIFTSRTVWISFFFPHLLCASSIMASPACADYQVLPLHITNKHLMGVATRDEKTCHYLCARGFIYFLKFFL